MTYRRMDGRTDRQAEAITIPPLNGVVIIKKNTMSRALIGFRFIFIQEVRLINMYNNYTCMYYLYFPIQDMDW